MACVFEGRRFRSGSTDGAGAPESHHRTRLTTSRLLVDGTYVVLPGYRTRMSVYKRRWTSACQVTESWTGLPDLAPTGGTKLNVVFA